jgi:hypothetical protein
MKNNTYSHTLIFGTSIGFIIIVIQFVLYVFGMLNNNASEIVIFFLMVLGTMFSVRYFRDHLNEGSLNFRKALQIGFLTCVFMGVIGSIYTYFQIKYLTPHMADEAYSIAQASILNKGYTDEQVQLGTEMIKNHMPLIFAISNLFRFCFLGAILSLVAASLLKNAVNSINQHNPDNNL